MVKFENKKETKMSSLPQYVTLLSLGWRKKRGVNEKKIYSTHEIT